MTSYYDESKEILSNPLDLKALSGQLLAVKNVNLMAGAPALTVRQKDRNRGP